MSHDTTTHSHTHTHTQPTRGWKRQLLKAGGDRAWYETGISHFRRRIKLFWGHRLQKKIWHPYFYLYCHPQRWTLVLIFLIQTDRHIKELVPEHHPNRRIRLLRNVQLVHVLSPNYAINCGSIGDDRLIHTEAQQWPCYRKCSVTRKYYLFQTANSVHLGRPKSGCILHLLLYCFFQLWSFYTNTLTGNPACYTTDVQQTTLRKYIVYSVHCRQVYHRSVQRMPTKSQPGCQYHWR